MRTQISQNIFQQEISPDILEGLEEVSFKKNELPVDNLKKIGIDVFSSGLDFTYAKHLNYIDKQEMFSTFLQGNIRAGFPNFSGGATGGILFISPVSDNLKLSAEVFGGYGMKLNQGTVIAGANANIKYYINDKTVLMLEGETSTLNPKLLRLGIGSYNPEAQREMIFNIGVDQTIIPVGNGGLTNPTSYSGLVLTMGMKVEGALSK